MKGVTVKYWDKPWSLVDGCTPCSPGCDHCWSAAMASRFQGNYNLYPAQVVDNRMFIGNVFLLADRLSIPLKRKKPTVYAVWNDFFHESVPTEFIDDALEVMAACPQHTFLVLTKRAHLMEEKIYGVTPYHGCRALGGGDYLPNVWWGLTVCNQQEADEKIPVFLQAPGKKFLSIEPMLGEIDINEVMPIYIEEEESDIQAIILGGETGLGARPMHPDWVRSVRDQCAAAGVLFFFKGWGEWVEFTVNGRDGFTSKHYWLDENGTLHDQSDAPTDDCVCVKRTGKKAAGRLLDGRTHDDLPWRTNASI